MPSPGAIGNKVVQQPPFLTFFDDDSTFNIDAFVWFTVEIHRNHPCGCAGAGAASTWIKSQTPLMAQARKFGWLLNLIPLRWQTSESIKADFGYPRHVDRGIDRRVHCENFADTDIRLLSCERIILCDPSLGRWRRSEQWRCLGMGGVQHKK